MMKTLSLGALIAFTSLATGCPDNKPAENPKNDVGDAAAADAPAPPAADAGAAAR